MKRTNRKQLMKNYLDAVNKFGYCSPEVSEAYNKLIENKRRGIMTNKELETKIKDRLKKLSKDTIIELYLQAKFEQGLPTEIEEQYKVGDRVQFKSWDEMEKEFVVDGFGDIFIKGTLFSARMKHLCETYATITKIEKKYVSLRDFTANGDTDWNYTLDMLKPATDEPKCKFEVGDKVLVYQGKKVGIVEFVPTIHDDLYKVGFMDGDCDFFAEEDMTPYTEPRWTFTDDEKVILRNVLKDYKWLVRDEDGELYIHEEIPHKLENMWNSDRGYIVGMCGFNHLFQSIKWTDEQPCEFRKYL